MSVTYSKYLILKRALSREGMLKMFFIGAEYYLLRMNNIPVCLVLVSVNLIIFLKKVIYE